MPYTIMIEGIDEAKKAVSSIPEDIKKYSDEILNRITDEAVITMEENAPDFTGTLKESIGSIHINPNETIVGPLGAGENLLYPPSHYAYAVEHGKGPHRLPNPTDIALRLGIDIEEAFAFAKWLQRTGKAVRQTNAFVMRTYQIMLRKIVEIINNSINRFRNL